mmetsp:Transcript_17668/g.57398  ORF Transcript_17668/g.57398 Transcript_17668/m.57398 type:complete len:302 (-) Transcript_17668:18-923(-)
MFSRASLLRLIPAAATPVFVASCDEASARSAIAKLIEDSEEKRDDGTSMGPTFVRLAWHASGTWCAKTKTGGSDGGRMKFCPESRWGANAGLAEARRLIEGVATAHGLSRADAFTLGGVVAIEGMGGPTIAWQAGRSDAADGSSSPPDGRLPDADKGTLKGTVQHLRDIFHRMGFDDKDIVALSGAHALGRCHETASGYWGPWTFAETTFSNEYFRLLLEETWTLKTTHNGHAWTGPDQFEDPSGKLMMLPSDLLLRDDAKLRKWAEIYAADNAKFLADFSAAFNKLEENGCTGLTPVDWA